MHGYRANRNRSSTGSTLRRIWPLSIELKSLNVVSRSWKKRYAFLHNADAKWPGHNLAKGGDDIEIQKSTDKAPVAPAALEQLVSNCEYCGNALAGEEVESPYKDEGGYLMCDECYREHKQFICDLCEEYGDIKDQHKMLIVWDSEEARVSAGLYKVKKLPYYTANMLGDGWIHPWAVERIDNVPRPQNDDDYPCGHLCGGCQREFYEMASSLAEMNAC